MAQVSTIGHSAVSTQALGKLKCVSSDAGKRMAHRVDGQHNSHVDAKKTRARLDNGSTVDVTETHYVVFPKVWATLHLHNDKHSVSNILQPMPFSSRNVCGLVSLELKYPLTAGNLGDATDDHPMLAPMVMHLKR